jgi:hypothetical protein
MFARLWEVAVYQLAGHLSCQKSNWVQIRNSLDNVIHGDASAKIGTDSIPITIEEFEMFWKEILVGVFQDNIISDEYDRAVQRKDLSNVDTADSCFKENYISMVRFNFIFFHK